ncbi:prepilin-type N-terminal cleavage/methylation domain-containing protein [Microbacterium sp. M3]|uniref:Prepilin-type N-terminal cleavage/methylation domain-containing protein n=1 Tax=Microbacterium arthrosphaerae TaxID=792652 RepID=A0ABU4GYT6_9MICO|nr:MULTISPECIES: prepilin-type N-terminal cleavage/methylation domain-containing protein [Microbacterium]MDW4572233.1 prepilin-type N-terminal cleavage/methylation domain-containing protein [Microbacterium arthrosphaerae]MDW7606088.1 prepilin-type N-terminal cleavage/methylation domain-containing protein [Microbacterium sp. M3]
MRGRSADAAGFSLVEVVIAMFLLGIIAVAILPALWQGIQISSQQSAVATATRHLNALIEEMRENAQCTRTIAVAGVGTIPAVPHENAFTGTNPANNGVAFDDGKGEDYDVTVQGGLVSGGGRAVYDCVPGAVVPMQLTVVDSSGKPVVSVTAKILMGN